MFSMGRTTPKIALSHGGISIPIPHMVPWICISQLTNGISIGSANFAQYTHETNTQTDT